MGIRIVDTLPLIFSHDRYQDGGNLAAMVQGLEAGGQQMSESANRGWQGISTAFQDGNFV